MCLKCGVETDNPRFCSRSCSASYNNVLQPRRRWHCKKCHKNASRPSKWASVCSDCRAKPTIDYTLGEVRKRYADVDRSSRHSLINGRARGVLKSLGRTSCEWEDCDWNYSFQAAHIKPTSEHPDETRLSVVNSPENLRALCPNHHWLFDHKPL